MRVIFYPKDLESFFNTLKSETGLSWLELSKKAQVSKRAFLDWRKGRASVPIVFLEKIKKEFGIDHPLPRESVTLSSLKSAAGRIGGKTRAKLYGNPGTKEGRILGGTKSAMLRATKPNSPFSRKITRTPLHSLELAEFVGILLGDGGVTSRQISITLHKINDREYADYVSILVKKIFNLIIKIKERRTENVNTLLISRTDLVDYFESIGIKKGSKVRNQVDVPEWIRGQKNYRVACLRGLFDTDGCVFVDSHVIRGKTYRNVGINFTNHSLPLLQFFEQGLKELGLSPTKSGKFSLFLRRENDIVRYFKIVGSSNPKHLRKFNNYFKEKGRVPKWL